MSRIGKKLVQIPAGVIVTVNDGLVVVKGAKSQLEFRPNPEIEVVVEGSNVLIKAKDELKRLYPLWGLTRALIANMVKGVTEGFEKKLELVGVGYRAKQNGSDAITLTVGFSHPVEYKAPQGIELIVPDQSNITIKGADKHMVGFVAASIRKVRPPEPYKGKGIKYSDEVVRRKAGKAGKAAGGAAK